MTDFMTDPEPTPPKPAAPVAIDHLHPVAYRGVPVLTTEGLATAYGTAPENIWRNHASNADRFVEGKHLFKVTGSDLADLRLSQTQAQISAKTRALVLWTERGAARHAKMLQTDTAWDVFEALEDAYFRRRPDDTPASPATHRFIASGDMAHPIKDPPSVRFREEVARLGYDGPKAFAKQVGWSGSKLHHFEHLNMVPKKVPDMHLLIGLGFDLRYLIYGERTVSRAELDLIAAYRAGDTTGIHSLVAARPPRLTDET